MSLAKQGQRNLDEEQQLHDDAWLFVGLGALIALALRPRKPVVMIAADTAAEYSPGFDLKPTT